MASIVYDGRKQPIGKEMILGRWRGCTLQVRDDKASRKHARLAVGEDGALWLEDLGSVNGTELNGTRVREPQRIAHGDRITIGDANLTVELDAVERSSARLPAIKPRRETDDVIGQIVGGCRVVSLIGSGTASTVYRARQVATGRDVALRLFNGEVADAALARVRKAASVVHESLTIIHDAGRDEAGLAWCVAELVDGDNLERVIERDGPLSPPLAALVLERVALALQVAHEAGLAHGDINPRTVLLGRDAQVKVLDLGLSDTDGDPAYAAPERAGREPRPADDIYALGGTLYHLLVGAPPYPTDDPAELAQAHRERPLPDILELREDVPRKLADLLTGMLNKNPAWRYATMREVLDDLRPLRLELATPVMVRDGPRPARGDDRDAATTPRRVRSDSLVAQADAEARRVQSLGVRLLVIVGAVLVLSALAPVVMRYATATRGAPTPRGDATVQRGPPDGTTTSTTAGSSTTTRLGAHHDANRGDQPPIATKQPLPDLPVPTTSGGGRLSAAEAEEGWRALQAQLASDKERGWWGAAQRQLAAFIAEAAGDAREAARLCEAQLEIDGAAWYRDQIASLPPLDRTGALAQAVTALARLRDVVLSGDRADAESRYQEAVTLLTQRLAGARREARLAIDSGAFAKLPAIAAGIAPSFVGTPMEGLQRQFAAATTEAVAAARSWSGSWAATRPRLLASTGTDALPAAAALLLHGDVDEAKRLLAREPALAAGAALRRREQLLGRTVALLTFDDPGDLQYIEPLAGSDVTLAGGMLTAVGDAAGIACGVPVGGNGFDITATFVIAGADSQVVWSIVSGGAVALQVRVEHGRATVDAGVDAAVRHQDIEMPSGARQRLRIAGRDRHLTVALGDARAFEADDLTIAAGSQLRLEGAGWKLDDLQVVGGE